MCNRNIWFVATIMLCGFGVNAQNVDLSFIEIDSVQVDTTQVPLPENKISHPEAIKSFYRKLSQLTQRKSGKVNIVHIGDSHIQADLMTSSVRKRLQDEFGNAGRGFVFPHSLAKTNGSSDVQFSSSGKWDSYRNIYPPNGSAVGLSGIALSSKSGDHAIELKLRDAATFTSIQIITPQNRDIFNVATQKKTVVIEKPVAKIITHKIRSGEAISTIADKYNVSVSALKKANGLKSNTIRAGKTLRIPGTQTQKVSIEKSEYVPIPMQAAKNSHYYNSAEALDRIYIVPKKDSTEIAMNGIILQNHNSGVLYHNIGVNGAKLSDFSKYPLFFDQLKSLAPDLIIVSLGTNESFDKMAASEYLTQMNIFIDKIKTSNPNSAILMLTPPPSQFKRRYPNTLVADYARTILASADKGNFSVYDLYSQLGGLYGVARNAAKGIIGGDRVHYSKAGYELQGNLLAEAIINGFNDFKAQGQ